MINKRSPLLSSLLLLCAFSSQSCAAFVGPSSILPSSSLDRAAAPVALAASANDVAMDGSSSASSPSYLYDPSARDEHYGDNVARYLVDLHDAKATFDFCGGMMFQLVLSEKLKSHLEETAASSAQRQPVVHDAKAMRMSSTPDYGQDSSADNVSIFHGREIRSTPDAAGGMGFVLQLSYAGDGGDPEGWTPQEVAGYNGWMHDQGRVWRKGDRYEEEGFANFRERFGADAFGLHHRCYLHKDFGNKMWLSAEDGCEGTPAESSPNVIDKLQSMLFGR